MPRDLVDPRFLTDGGIHSRLPPVGTVLDGKYRIEGYVGSGSVGCVAKARHLVLEADVALKFLASTGPARARLPERFRREAIATSRVRTEHVVQILDVVEERDQLPYLVMEFLDGDDLRQIISREGALPLARALHIVLQVLCALEAAHEAQVIHRDLKPANVFVLKRGGDRDFVKVVDFGISKVEETGVRHTRLTQGEVAMGTPLYMAPEQARDARSVTATADVYSAAALLYECLTGSPPLTAPTTEALFEMLLRDVPARLDQVLPQMPSGLSDAVAAALEKSPKARPPSAAAFARLLAPYADVGAGSLSWLRGSDVPETRPQGTPAPAEVTVTVRPRPRAPATHRPLAESASPLMLALLGAVGFGLTFLAGVLLLRVLGIAR